MGWGPPARSLCPRVHAAPRLVLRQEDQCNRAMWRRADRRGVGSRLVANHRPSAQRHLHPRRKLRRLLRSHLRTLRPPALVALRLGTRPTGAPYLARFSRDVGFHEPKPALPVEQKNFAVWRSGIPHLAKNERDMGTQANATRSGRPEARRSLLHRIRGTPNRVIRRGPEGRPLNVSPAREGWVT